MKRILTLLASGGRALTLTEIAQELEISLSTCQAILNSLTEGAFLMRSPAKRTYTLGPALVRLGQVARSLIPTSALVEEEVEALHKEVGFGCTALAVVDRELVVVSQVGPPESFPVRSMSVGPFPFVAPFGATIMAFKPDTEIKRWFSGANDVDDDLHIRQLLATVRSVGYAVSVYSAQTQLVLPEFDKLQLSLEGSRNSLRVVQDILRLLALSGSRWYLEEELKSSEQLSVTLITAPVLSARMDIELHVHVYRRGLSRGDVTLLASAAVAACRRIERRLADETSASSLTAQSSGAAGTKG